MKKEIQMKQTELENNSNKHPTKSFLYYNNWKSQYHRKKQTIWATYLVITYVAFLFQIIMYRKMNIVIRCQKIMLFHHLLRYQFPEKILSRSFQPDFLSSVTFLQRGIALFPLRHIHVEVHLPDPHVHRHVNQRMDTLLYRRRTVPLTVSPVYHRLLLAQPQE